MKRLLIVSSIVFLYFISYGQDIPKCVNCDGKGMYGTYSGNVGEKNLNYGNASLIVGSSNTIGDKFNTITNSVLMGSNSTIGVGLEVNGSNSFLFGQENVITENNSYILGTNSTVSAEGGASIGRGNTVEGNYSTAIGTWCSTSGIYGTAFGRSAVAAKNSTAIGWWSEASGEASFTFGRRVKSSVDNAMTIGRGRSTSYLENNIESSLMIGFNSTVPTFFVSESSASDKSGKIGIGNITDPQAKLHVRADEGEEASIFLQTNHIGSAFAVVYFESFTKSISSYKGYSGLDFQADGGSFNFQNGNINIQSGFNLQADEVRTASIIAADANGLSLYNQNGQGISISDDGNVGIGTNDPTAKLDIDGTLHTSGQVTFDNNLEVTGDAKFDNNLSIGCNPNAGYILSVKGKVLSEDITVVETVGADFVFAKDYQLPKLTEVESFIEKNNHLQEIPSAEEMIKEGIDVGKLQIKLLQKVEELTLYTIEQQKAIEKQAKMIEELKAEIAK